MHVVLLYMEKSAARNESSGPWGAGPRKGPNPKTSGEVFR